MQRLFDLCINRTHGRWLYGVAAVAASASIAAATAGPAGAANFTVTAASMCGTGSLKEAVTKANASAGPDTIGFAAGIKEIGINSGCPNMVRAGTWALHVSDDLTVNGPVRIIGGEAWLDQNGNVSTSIISCSNVVQVAASPRFIEIGTLLAGSGVNVTLNQVNVRQAGNFAFSLPQFASINDHSSLSINRSSIEGISDGEGAGSTCSQVNPISVGHDSTFKLTESLVGDTSSLGPLNSGMNAIINARSGSHVVVDRSVFMNTRPDMGAIESFGGDVKVVSTVSSNGGGVGLFSAATGQIVNTAITETRGSSISHGLVVSSSTATLDGSTIAVEPYESNDCRTAVLVAPASAIYQSGAGSSLTVSGSVIGNGLNYTPKWANLPVWQKDAGTLNVSDTWTNADLYGQAPGSGCPPGYEVQSALPGGISTGALGLYQNTAFNQYPYQGLPAPGVGSKIIGKLSTQLLNPIDSSNIDFDAYSTYLKIADFFKIGLHSWPGWVSHHRMSPDGLRDLGALQQLQFAVVATATGAPGKAVVGFIDQGTPPAAITSHEIRYRLTGTSAWITGPTVSVGSKGLITHLIGGKTYDFQVRAVTNGLGPSPWSNVAQATPPPPLPVSISCAPSSAAVGTSIPPIVPQLSNVVPPSRFGATNLPSGISVSASTGVISGTPTSTGLNSITLTVTDSLGSQATTNCSLGVAPASTPVPAELSYPDMFGTKGFAIGLGIPSVAGIATLASHVARGLPVGLSVDPVSGRIYGIPVATGVFFATVKATDAYGTTTSNTFTVTILEPIVPVHLSYPPAHGRVGTPIVPISPQVSGVSGVRTFRAGHLPTGLKINSSTGAINGTPHSTGAWRVPVLVFKGDKSAFTWAKITVGTGSTGRRLSYPTGRGLQGSPISPMIGHLVGVSGNKRYGTKGLPKGLFINRSTGTITGRPQVPGLRHFRVTVVGANGRASWVAAIYVTRLPGYKAPRPAVRPPTFTG